MKIKSIIILIIMLCLLSGGALVQAEEPLTLKLAWEPDDTFNFVWFGRGHANLFMYSSLLTCNSEMLPEHPDLAEDWQISEDELTYTFYLKDDLKFHDGEPLTADDVCWSLENAIISPRTHGMVKTPLKEIKGADKFTEGETDSVSGIKKLDDKTIEVTFDNRAGTFLLAVSQLAILPKHLLEDEDPKRMHLAEFWQKPVGSGPFKIVEREPGNYTILEPFEDYHKGKPELERVVFRNWDNPVLAAEKEELDFWMTMDVTESQEIEELSYMKVNPQTIGYLRCMWINMENAPLEDNKVRQAMRYALDIESIVNDLFEGYGNPLNDFMIPGFWTNKVLDEYEYNPEKAKGLLEEAGWDSDREIDLTYYYEDQITKDLMATIQYYWEQVGIKSELRLLQGNIAEILYETKDFDLVYGAISTIEPSELVDRYLSDNSLNNTGYSNPDVDKLVEMGTRYREPIIRKALYDQVQKIVHDDFPIMPLFTLNTFIIESDRLKIPEEVEISNLWYNHKLDMEDWKLE